MSLFQSFFKMYQIFLIVYKPEKMDYIKISGLGKTQEEIQTEKNTERKLETNYKKDRYDSAVIINVVFSLQIQVSLSETIQNKLS